MAYATKTTVPAERTRAEIERLVVEKHKATQYVQAVSSQPVARAVIQFRMLDRIVRFEVPLPPVAPAYASARARQTSEQDTRTRWRALLLIIKAKLEAVEQGVTTFEEEFLAHIVMPGDRTVGDYVIPHIAEAYTSGQMPKLLPAFTDRP